MSEHSVSGRLGGRYTLQFGPQIPCPHCRRNNLILANELYRYLWDDALPCYDCEHSIDLFGSLREFLLSADSPEIAMAFVGAEVPMIKVSVAVDDAIEVRFEEYGLPNDANVLAVLFAGIPAGSSAVVPYTRLPERLPGKPPHQLDLLGLARGADRTALLNVTVVWMPPGAHTPQRQLAAAMVEFIEGRHSAVVIPANTAVESVITPLVDLALTHYAGKERVRTFLDAAGYSHQLNIVLPVLAAAAGLPRMPATICGALTRLNRLRNDQAHRGELGNVLSKRDTAEFLTAAILAIAYARMLHPVLVEGKRSRRPTRPRRQV